MVFRYSSLSQKTVHKVLEFAELNILKTDTISDVKKTVSTVSMAVLKKPSHV